MKDPVELKVSYLCFELISPDDQVFRILCDKILMNPSFPIAIFGDDLHMTVKLEKNRLEDLAHAIKDLEVDVIEY